MSWFNRWFKKAEPAKLPTVAEALAALERLGIRRRPDVSIDDLLYSTGGTLDDPVEYLDLLCMLGDEVEREDFRPKSDDLWHFDTECIVDDGDYVSIVERLVRMSKGALAVSNITDRVDRGESIAWLELDFQGKRVHWDLEFNDDWVDAKIFTRIVELFRKIPSDARFTYGDLGGQDCLIGFATEEQRQQLTALTEQKFEWLK
jgi:hypothetical protein